ncbi:invasion associated locus B family protein, partial [Methylobacterium sp. WL9]
MSRRLDALAARLLWAALVGATALPLAALAQQPAKPPAAKPGAPAPAPAAP